MDGPFRLVLDFEDTLYRWKLTPVAVGTDPVKALRGSQFRKGVARLVIELGRTVSCTLDPHAEGLRVVFVPSKTATPVPAAAAPPARPPAQAAKPAVAARRLQGIVTLDETAVAYITDASNQVKRYAVGDPIGDGVVETIEERRVALKTPRARSSCASRIRARPRRPRGDRAPARAVKDRGLSAGRSDRRRAGPAARPRSWRAGAGSADGS